MKNKILCIKPSSMIVYLVERYGSYRKVANVTGLSHSTLLRIHMGEFRNSSYKTYFLIYKAYYNCKRVSGHRSENS
jgi:hypothetical protein